MSDDPALSSFHRIVVRWFCETFAEPTPAPRDGWPANGTGRHSLLLAPTGSGRTLPGFLHSLIDFLTGGDIHLP